MVNGNELALLTICINNASNVENYRPENVSCAKSPQWIKMGSSWGEFPFGAPLLVYLCHQPQLLVSACVFSLPLPLSFSLSLSLSVFILCAHVFVWRKINTACDEKRVEHILISKWKCHLNYPKKSGSFVWMRKTMTETETEWRSVQTRKYERFWHRTSKQIFIATHELYIAYAIISCLIYIFICL